VPIWAWSAFPGQKVTVSREREWSGSAASITSHLGKTDVVLVSVSESSDPDTIVCFVTVALKML